MTTFSTAPESFCVIQRHDQETFEACLLTCDAESERIHTLSELKLGRLPPLFAPKLEGCGMRIAELLQGMLRGDDDHRLSCAEVQKELEDIIAGCDT